MKVNRVLALLVAAWALSAGAAEGKRPNVLFIAVDDLNDYVSLLRGYPGLKTPNLDRFANTAVTFTRAYCAAPVCNPSRTAIASGIRPGRTGVYDNDNPMQSSAAVMDCVLMPEHFKANGYRTMWSGKFLHTKPPPERNRAMWDDARGGDGGYGPMPMKDPLPAGLVRPPMFTYEAWTGPETAFADVRNSEITVRRLGEKYDRPFFMVYGNYRPHNPWTAPKRFFDMYPADRIEMPPVLERDLDDVPATGVKWAMHPVSWRELKERGQWRPIVQSYLASISFMDEEVGKVLEALDRSEYRDNTIVILWADHGFHMGEKLHFAKYALWELTTHTLLMARVPGVTPGGVRCERTVNLIDLYPTLIDLCGLPGVKQKMDGVSLRKLLADPGAAWERPAVTTYLQGNHAVRNERWRYIKYADGGEELYDDVSDPNEWKNVAGEGGNASIKAELGRWMPGDDVVAVKPMGKKGKKDQNAE